jgi:3-hydroxy acid dehydrogenase / malonic semialdehyde reductase
VTSTTGTTTDGARSLAGRVAMVTGGGSGIGAATSDSLARLGASVVAVDLRAKPTDLGPALTPGVVLTQGDVRDYGGLQRLRDDIVGRHGRLDIVVANAGLADWGELVVGDPSRWRNVLETNVLGVALAVRSALPGLVEQGHGHIVITSSVSGRVTYRGEPIYIASKWALVGLGRALRKEVSDSGVRVTLIEPGIVDTPLVSGTPEGREELANVVALTAQDVADAITYAVTRPAHVDVDELMLSPVRQAL